MDRVRQLLPAILITCALAASSHALEPAYLEGWPSAERVLEDTQGKDDLDTMARQMAALELLRRSVEGLAGPRLWRGLTPDEERLRGEYWTASKKIATEAQGRLSNELGRGFHGPFAKPPLQEWYDTQWEYEQDPEFRAATLGRYLPPTLLNQLAAQEPASDAARAGSGKRKGLPIAIPAIIAFILLAFVVRAWRRRSARRDEARAPAPEPRGSMHQRSVYEAAAREVVDTLTPYFIAAQRDGRPIPARVLFDSGLQQFLLTYCWAAVRAVTGKESEQLDVTDAVFVFFETVLGEHQRLPLDGPMPTAAQLMASLKSNRDETTALLSVTAMATLGTFARTGENSFLADTPSDSDPGGLKLVGDPPATRLHPHGPHAEAGQRLALAFLTKKIARLAAEPA